MKLVHLLTIFSLLKGLTGKPYKENSLSRAHRVLSDYPVVDGHNDFPMAVRDLLKNDLSKLHFDQDLTEEEPWASYWANHCDLPRMRKGKMGGQFWSAYVGCKSQFKDAVQLFIEQIDLIKQIVDRYPDDLMWADSADGIEEAMAAGKIASMIGVESGHAIGSSLPILRSLYSLGARYMTLTHGCNTPWADASQVEEGSLEARNDGLSEFGEQIVLEMNRLGMLVDLSHVSADTMRQAIRVSKAPVIFSHSSSRAVSAHARNVPDDVLTMVKANRGIVMVNFYACFLVDDCDSNNATVKDIVKHINHIRKIAGVDSVGIGGDFNGVETPPVDISD